MSGGGAAVPHAGGRVRERVLAQEVLLHLWVPHPCLGGGHLRSHRLQELWHAPSVSLFFCFYLFVLEVFRGFLSVFKG